MKERVLLAVTAVSIIIMFMGIIQRGDIYSFSVPHSLEHSGRPKIVFWAKPKSIDWTFPRLNSGDGGCDISVDRKDLDEADAVVFMMKSCRKKDFPPPQSRRQNQTYVWYVRESPWTVRYIYKQDLVQYNDYFNWTMSYRMDSDIVGAMWPTPAMDYLFQKIGRTEDMLDTKLSQKPRLHAEDYRWQIQLLLKKKNKLIAWIVSNCKTTAGAKQRATTATKIQSAGLKVSKFGKCAGNPLPYNLTVLFETMSHFKFYLAFENSFHCKDYITEKVFYNAFVSGTVPIIHGPTKADVAKILPKKSYIHLEDFKNMQELKEYLLFLDKNDSAYSEYFQWWMEPGAQLFPRYGFNYGVHYAPRVPQLPQFTSLDVEDHWLDNQRFALYHLCRRLKRGDHLRNSYVVKNLAELWFSGDTPECVAR